MEEPRTPAPPPTPDDGHAPCWHQETHPIARNHGQFQQGTALTPYEQLVVILCCFCGARIVRVSGAPEPLPLTHAGATVETQTTPGESASHPGVPPSSGARASE